MPALSLGRHLCLRDRQASHALATRGAGQMRGDKSDMGMGIEVDNWKEVGERRMMDGGRDGNDSWCADTDGKARRGGSRKAMIGEFEGANQVRMVGVLTVPSYNNPREAPWTGTSSFTCTHGRQIDTRLMLTVPLHSPPPRLVFRTCHAVSKIHSDTRFHTHFFTTRSMASRPFLRISMRGPYDNRT